MKYSLSLSLLVYTVLAPCASAHTIPNATQLMALDLESPFGLGGQTEYTDVWAEGDFAYIGSDNAGVAVVGIGSQTPMLSHVGTYAPSGHADFQDVKVLNGVGYFSGSTGTDIVNTAIPQDPQPLARIDAAIGGHTSAQNVAIDGNFLYQVANNSPDIHVFDVSNPTGPTFVRTIDTQDSVGISDVTLINDRLFATGLGGATYLYDVANVATNVPNLTSAIPTGPNTSSAWPTEDGDTLIVTHRELGGELAAWDINSLTSPTLIDSVDPSDLGFSSFSTSEVVVVGSLAYVAWYQGGLEVIDLDSLETDGLQRAGFYVNNSGSVFDELIDIRSVYPMLGPDRVLASHTRFGLFVIDVTPLEPLLSGDYDGDGFIGPGDYEVWKTAFGTTNSAADGNRDGIVDAADYTVWLDSLGAGTVPVTSNSQIPEPTSQALFFILAMVATVCISPNRNSWRIMR